MSDFNIKVVESLDYLNKVLAGIFVSLALLKFFDLVMDNLLGAVIESLTIFGVGILTCGYIAVMININNNLAAIREKIKARTLVKLNQGK